MNNKSNILLVDDDPGITNYLNTILSMNGFEMLHAKNSSDAYMMITSYCPDLILLELNLSDIDGVKIIKSVREWSGIPIIVLSTRSHERDKVHALDSGANDYITKPFGSAELLARIRAALRTSRIKDNPKNICEDGVFQTRDFTLDFEKRYITVRGSSVHLTQNEYRIVALLARYAGKVLTYDYIIKCIWGPNAEPDNQILRVNMANIRKKIELKPSEPEYILTETGVGYRMTEEREAHRT